MEDYQDCYMLYCVHTYEQFLQITVSLGLGLILIMCVFVGSFVLGLVFVLLCTGVPAETHKV